jgi:hypothetical protein
VAGVDSVATPDANPRETVLQIGDEQRIPLDEKETLGLDSLFEKRTSDGSGPRT